MSTRCTWRSREGVRAGRWGWTWWPPGWPWSGSRTSAGSRRGRDGRGQLRWRWEYCPLADGQAPLPEFVDLLRRMKYDGVVSLHSEYKGETSFRRMDTPELLA